MSSVHEIGGDRDELGGGSAIGQLRSDVLYEACISVQVDTDADGPRTWEWGGRISLTVGYQLRVDPDSCAIIDFLSENQPQGQYGTSRSIS